MPSPSVSRADYFQKRLERIERLKDDPYYIFDKKELEKPIASTSSDIDSIPIVRLDDLMPIAPGAPYSARRCRHAYSFHLHCSTSTT
jgi:AP-3 complex subunit delta-1